MGTDGWIIQILYAPEHFQSIKTGLLGQINLKTQKTIMDAPKHCTDIANNIALKMRTETKKGNKNT